MLTNPRNAKSSNELVLVIPDESKLLKNLKLMENSGVSSNHSSPTKAEHPSAIPQLAQELLASFKVNSRVTSVVQAFRFGKEADSSRMVPTPKGASPPEVYNNSVKVPHSNSHSSLFQSPKGRNRLSEKHIAVP